MVAYEIQNWDKFNTVLEYECRSYKDCGFFFFPICYADMLLEGRVCSELDAVMDLWLNTIYMDERVEGSDLGAGGLFPQRLRQSPYELRPDWFAMGLLKGKSVQDDWKAGGVGVYQHPAVLRRSGQYYLSQQLSIHHVQHCGRPG